MLRRMRKRVLAALAAAAATTVAAPAQHEGIAPPPAYTCSIVLDDPLPWVHTLLRSDALDEAMRTGSIGDAIALAGMQQQLQPKLLSRQLRLFEHFVPKHVAVRFPPETGGAFGAWLRATTAASLGHAASYAEDVDAETVSRLRDEVREAMLNGIREALLARVHVELQCRDERTAGDWFDAIADWSETLATDEDLLTFRHSGDGCRVTFVPGRALERDATATFLAEWFGHDDEELADAVWQLLQRVSVRLDSRLAGDRIQLHLYPTGLAPLEPREPVTTRAPSIPGTPVMSARYDLRQLLAHIRAARELWRRWQPTEIGRIAASFDEQQLLGDLATLVESIEGAAQLDFALNWSDRELTFSSAWPASGAVRLRGDPLLGLVPQDTATLALDGSRTFAQIAYDGLLRVEDRIHDRSLQALLGDDEAQAAEADEQVRAYYERMGGVRSLLRDELPRSLQPPTLTLFGTCEGQQQQPSVIALAFVTRLQRRGSGIAVAQRIAREVSLAIDPDADLDALSFDDDLGLGVPTVSLPMAEGLGALLGDLRPHLFEFRGNLVLSSSVGTSRAILAGPHARFEELPADTTALTIGNGARVATTIVTLGEQIGTLLRGVQAAGEPVRHTLEILDVAAELTRMVGPVTFHLRETDATATGTGSARFRATKEQQRPALDELVARCREALGAWPADAAVLEASGTTRYGGSDGTFSFSCGRDGRFHNRIDVEFRERSTTFCDQPWAVHTDPTPISMGTYECDLLTAWDAILSGQWTEPLPGLELRLADDTLPGTGPEVLLVGTRSTARLRVQIDPGTFLPTALRMNGQSLQTAGWLRLDDFRAVEGRMLPHRIFRDGDGDHFAVSAWSVREQAPADIARPAATADFELADACEVPLVLDGGIARVRIGGETNGVWVHLIPSYTHCSLTRHAIERLGGTFNASGALAQLPAFAVGDATIRDVTVRVQQYGPSDDADDENPTTMHGTLGPELFRRACVTLDFARSMMRVEPLGAFDERGFDWTPVENVLTFPSVPVELVPGVTVPAALVFYRDFDVSFVQSLAACEIELPPTEARRTLHPLLGECLVTTLAGARIGPHAIENARVLRTAGRIPEASYASSIATLGFPILTERFVLHLDLANDRVAFVPR